jgi:serine/threonine-protein kinase
LTKPLPAYRGELPYTFVSYAHGDSDVVFAELERLQDDGLRVWYDAGIAPGGEWTQEIADAIDGATGVVYFVSGRSVASRHCRREVQYALEQNKPVLPVYLEPTDLPGGLRLALGPTQAVLRHDMDAAQFHARVLQALQNQVVDDDLSREVGSADLRPARAGRRSKWAVAGVFAAAVLGVALYLAEPRQPGRPHSAEPSIAVLPVRNLTGEAALDYVADGIADALLGRLANVGNWEVIARTSSARFANPARNAIEAAERLGARYVVDGGMQKLGNRIRVSMALVGREGHTTLWSGNFDGAADELFELQDAIAENLLVALRKETVVAQPGTEVGSADGEAAVSSGRRHRGTDDLGAYQAWLEGVARLGERSREGVLAALALFKRAQELDPTYAKAWAGAAQSYMTMATWGLRNRDSDMAQARRAANVAIGYDARLPEPWVTLANVQSRYEWDFRRAEASLRKASALAPDSADVLAELGKLLDRVGKSDEAVATVERAWRLDPLNPAVAKSLTVRYIRADRLDDAGHMLARLLALSPEHGDRHWLRAQLALAHGDYKRALVAIEAEDLPHLRLSVAAIAQYHLGNVEASDRAVGELIATDGDASAFQVAEVYAQRGDLERTLEWLERAYGNRDPGLVELVSSGSFRPLYGHLALRDFAARLKLDLPRTLPA